MHNLYSKSFNEADYHYHDDFNETLHTDYDGDKEDVKPAVRGNPVD